ncbi:MAG: M36 family metallopeptidase [Deltaproteobacteria bacterium]|nr:M36 family metallopeptidase [Deltaproteobacteria bacterium]
MRKLSVVSLIATVAACASSSDRTTPPVVTGRDTKAAFTVVHRDDARGLPTFTRVHAPAIATDDPVAALRAVLEAQGVDDEVIRTAVLESVQTIGRGARVAQFSQRISDLDVFGGDVALALDDAGHPIALSGALVPTVHPKNVFTLTGPSAIARAVVTMTGVEPIDVTPSGQPAGGYTSFAVRLPLPKVVRAARSKPVWFDGKRLSAAYYVELQIGGADETVSQARSFIVDANDGAVLFEHDLVAADGFSYRVYAEASGTLVPWPGPHGSVLVPHPTGVPDATVVTPLPPSLVTLANAPFSKNDPWLPASATTTEGNNVVAYADLVEPDGFGTGDVRPKLTGPLSFDRAYDPTKNPNADDENIQATATQLFYVANWLHDWFYDAGWDEKSKNPQQSNLGRGALGNDPLLMEAQDFSGRNNANAMTPADGASPVVQMFLFNGQGKSSLAVTAPSAIAGALSAGTASFGPANFDVTESVVLLDDGVGTTSDACDKPLVNGAALKGKIVLIDRGTCTFTDKVASAEAVGAAGVLIANNVAGGLAPLGGTPGVEIKTPVLSITQADGAKIKAELAAGVTVRMVRETALDRDGGLDTSISSHEWGHVLSNRLIGNGNGLINNQGGGMGEGWSDFVALMTMLHASDVTTAAKNGYLGVYPIAGWVYGIGGGDGSYFGMRRYPYSADLTKNPLTFKHIQNGVALPKDVPLSFGEAGSNNAEVHAAGEVWAAMLWQCYVGLLRDQPRLDYAEANKRMRAYLVSGMKLTPREPTFIEARDALLTAMWAADPQDFRLCAKGFAARGAGTGAKAPPKASFNNVGVTESFVVGNDFEVLGVTLDPTTAACDEDAALDVGETGTLTIKLRNVGTDTLTGTTAQLSSKSGAFAFVNGGKITFPAFKPFETIEASIQVTLQKVTPASKQEIDIALDDATLAVPRTVTTTLPLWVDYDVKAEASAIDDVEADETVWRATGDKRLYSKAPWKRVREDFNQRWAIAGTPEIADQYLTSPPLTVSNDAPFTVSFVHRWSFERDQRARSWDGGVVEISTDDGATWSDIGESAYNGTLESKETDNPIKGRKAFVGKNAKYPAYEPVTLDLGAAYAGQTVRVRFRFGSDEGTASLGWDVDDIAFGGVTTMPFAARVPDTTQPCGYAPTDEPSADPSAAPRDDLGGGGCGCGVPRSSATSATSATSAGLGAGLGLALLVARRRRRTRA